MSQPLVQMVTGQPFPTLKQEDYRYSRVIQYMHSLQVQAKANHIAGDYIQRSVADLPEVFLRYTDFFKQELLSTSPMVHYQQLSANNGDYPVILHSKADEWYAPLLWLHVPEGQHATLILDLQAKNTSLLMPMIWIQCEPSSTLTIIHQASSDTHAVIMPHFEMMVQDQARIIWQSFQHNVSYQRFNLIGYINGEQADISLNGSFVLKKTDACDVFVRLFHEAGHNTSNQLFHALAYDQSVMNFNAQIAAGTHADQIQAYQMLRGMIMDEGAMIFARPQLDITYDDLACSHGVSIGGFDQESYFYLRSRGLAAKLAQQLLLQSYLSEPLSEGQRAQQWHHMISEALAHE